MPLAALLLVLGAAVCHSVWTLLVKSDARRLEIQSGALLVGVVFCSPALLIYPLTAVSPAAWGAVLVSGLFEAGYVFALTPADGAGGDGSPPQERSGEHTAEIPSLTYLVCPLFPLKKKKQSTLSSKRSTRRPH